MLFKLRYYILPGILAFTSPGHAQQVTLSLTVNNLKQATGAIVVSIFNREETFPIDGKEMKKMSFPVKALSFSCAIRDLERGDYAIAIYHDRNGDGICNLGILGIPREGFGFSRNFVPRLRAPAYEECRIALPGDTAITIDLIFK